MYWLAWGTSYCTHRKTLRGLLWIAIVAFRFTLTISALVLQLLIPVNYNLHNDLDLPVEPCCTTLDQGNFRRQAHPIDMSSSIQIIERIEDEIESLEPIEIELGIFDVGMVCFKLDVRVKFPGRFLCDLNKVS